MWTREKRRKSCHRDREIPWAWFGWGCPKNTMESTERTIQGACGRVHLTGASGLQTGTRSISRTWSSGALTSLPGNSCGGIVLRYGVRAGQWLVFVLVAAVGASGSLPQIGLPIDGLNAATVRDTFDEVH